MNKNLINTAYVVDLGFEMRMIVTVPTLAVFRRQLA